MRRRFMGMTQKPGNSHHGVEPIFTPKTATQVCSNVKIMVIIVLNIQGAVQSVFVPQGHTSNKHYYINTT